MLSGTWSPWKVTPAPDGRPGPRPRASLTAVRTCPVGIPSFES